MSQGDKFIGQPRDDPFRAAVEFGRHCLSKRSNLCYAQNVMSPSVGFGEALATLSGKI